MSQEKLQKSFIAYTTLDGRLMTLEIPFDAKFSAVSNYVRLCDKAKILKIDHINNDINDDKYTVGEFIFGDIEIYDSRESAMNFGKLIDLEELQKILDDHAAWLNDDSTGKRADFNGKYLPKVNLSGVDLSSANLEGVNLNGAKLNGINLTEADLKFADLRNADLSGANLSFADARNAFFMNANLKNVNFSGTDLIFSDLSGANLEDVKINERTTGFAPLCPMEGAFVAYKKVDDKIIVLEIPADARRNSSTNNFCRCDKAKVLRVENLDGTLAEENFVGEYVSGEIITAEDFEEERFATHGGGIYFFISREMAAAYDSAVENFLNSIYAKENS